MAIEPGPKRLMILVGSLAFAVHAGPAVAEASSSAAESPAPPTLPISGPPELIDRAEAAQAALAPLKRGLMSTLKAALAESPEAAVSACRLAAPGIAANASDEIHTVGRTSDRPRNPTNAPASWMQPLLVHYASAEPGDTGGTVVPLDGDAIGYVEPIYVQPLCTTCHGTAIDPELSAVIRDQYPDDQATGYSVGDFRGLFWVVAQPSR